MCLLLGFPSPEHMGRVLTFRQENQWYTFLKDDPQGQDRADILHAITVATMRSCAGQKSVTLSDYIPKFESPDPVHAEAMMKVRVDAFFDRFVAKHGYISPPTN